MRFITLFSYYWAIFAAITLHVKHHTFLLTAIGTVVSAFIAYLIGIWITMILTSVPITDNYTEKVADEYILSSYEGGSHFQFDEDGVAFIMPEEIYDKYPEFVLYSMDFKIVDKTTVPFVKIVYKEYNNKVLNWLFEDIYVHNIQLNLSQEDYDKYFKAAD